MGRPASVRAPRRTRRALAVIGAAATVALVVVAAAILWPNGNGVRTGASPSPGGRVPGVLRIDPRSGNIVASVDLRAQATPSSSSVAFGESFLWVLERAGLRKVNATGTVIGDPIEVGRELGCPTLGGLGCAATISAGEGSAWVTASPTASIGLGTQDSFLVKVDPLTDRIERFLLRDIGVGGAFATLPLAAGQGWVWTIDRSPPALVRIDPANPRRTDRFELGAPGDGIGIGFGSVWVRHNTGIESFLTRMDPRTGLVLETITVPGGADGFAFGGGSVWISDSSNDEVVEIDPASNTIADQFDVGVDPQAIVVDDDGGVWVNLTGEATLVKVDPATGEVVRRVPLGGIGGVAGIPTSRSGLAFGFGSVWVA
jgi:streptogramin lyase